MASDNVTPIDLPRAYQQVQQRIAAAAARSGRQASDILMVAVTKTATPDQIRTLVELGQADLGENRVQQLQQRTAQLGEWFNRRQTLGQASTRQREGRLPEKIRWHMIGHLQRNKVKQVVPLVQLVHSVDSLRLAEELHSYGNKHDVLIDVLLQVNTAGETQKSGLPPAAVLHMAEQVDSMVHLRLRGLMTMAPYSDNPEDSRDVFARTAELFNELRSSGIGGPDVNILSMGMTNDFEVAIEQGANLVRIGRALFG